MRQKCLLGVFFTLLLIGLTPAQDNVTDIRHETIAIYADDTSLPSIQAKGDVVQVTVLGAWVTDEDFEINHVIALSDPKIHFHIEYYAHKDDQIKIHLTVLGPTMATQSTDWLPFTKGFQYKSYFTYEGLKSFFQKGIYEVNLQVETKSASAGSACSRRCLVKFK